jgi:hypothetical protein
MLTQLLEYVVEGEELQFLLRGEINETEINRLQEEFLVDNVVC